MSVLGKRKELSAMEALVDACEWHAQEELKIVAREQDRKETSLLDALGVDLVFDNIVACLFSHANGIQSYTNVALVCKQTYKKAINHGRSNAILKQVYPYLPPMFKNTDDWSFTYELDLNQPTRELSSSQAFSLILFLSNPQKLATLTGTRSKLYQYLTDMTLTTTSMSMAHDSKHPSNQRRYYWLDPRTQFDSSVLQRAGEFVCQLNEGYVNITITWFSEVEKMIHLRRVVFNHQLAGNYVLEIGGDVEHDKINVIVHSDAKGYQLQQLTIDCSEIFQCGAGIPFDDDLLDNDQVNLPRHGVCMCADITLNGQQHGNVVRGISAHVYDFESLVNEKKESFAVDDHRDKRARKHTSEKLLGITGTAQQYITCHVMSNLTAYINLRTHEVSLNELLDTKVALPAMVRLKNVPSWAYKSNVCSVVGKTNTKRQEVMLPYFAYSCC